MDAQEEMAWQVAGSQALVATGRIMTWNVLVGGYPRIDAIEAVIRAAQPDFVGLQEVIPETLEALSQRLGMAWASAGPCGKRGLAVGALTRWPVRETQTHPDAPFTNGLLEMVVEPEGAAPLRIFVAHLVGAYTGWRAGEGSRLREIRYALARMSQARAATGEPQLIMGDFNSLPPGEPLQASKLLRRAARTDQARAQGADLKGLPGIAKVLPRPLRPLGNALAASVALPPVAWACDAIAGVYTPRAVIGEALAAGLVDLYAARRPSLSLRGGSCPAEEPAGRIDYIFASAPLADGLVSCDLLTDTPERPITRASDHLPALAEVTLPPCAGAGG